MRILFVSSQALFKESRFGGAKRLYYLAKELDTHSSLKVICLDGCHEIQESAPPHWEFAQTLFIPNSSQPQLSDRLGFLPDVKRTIKDHRAAIRTFIGSEAFDAIVLAFPAALRFIGDGLLSPAQKVIYIEDDLLLEQWRNRQANASTLWRKVIATFRLRHAFQYYKQALRAVTDFACISPQELQIVQSSFPGTSCWLLDYGLPLEDYPALPETAGHPTLGFIGNYHHAPNLDAALWLITTLFPAVQKAYSNARLIVCGTNMTAELQSAAAGNQAIQLLENVPELASFYRTITLFVNPIRQGRGLRTKLLEAAAFGRPIVSTPLGAEGLESFHIPLFNDAEGLVEALRLYESCESRQAASQKNRALLQANYSVEAITQRMLEKIAA